MHDCASDTLSTFPTMMIPVKLSRLRSTKTLRESAIRQTKTTMSRFSQRLFDSKKSSQIKNCSCLPAGTQWHPPLWIYWRTNSGVLTATLSWCTAAFLLLPSPPNQSCDYTDDSWYHSYKIRAPSSRSLFLILFSFSFLSVCSSCPVSLPVFLIYLKGVSASFFS